MGGCAFVPLTFCFAGRPACGETELASVFDPFLAGPVGGGGLSLAICKMIVEHHGGTLTAASDERSGVRLDIMLPAAS